MHPGVLPTGGIWFRPQLLETEGVPRVNALQTAGPPADRNTCRREMFVR